MHADSTASLILQYTCVPSLLHGPLCCLLALQTTPSLLFVVLRQVCIKCNVTSFPKATWKPLMDYPFDGEMNGPFYSNLPVDRFCDFPTSSNCCKTYVIRTARERNDARVFAQDIFSIDQASSIPLRLPGQWVTYDPQISPC